ncbi:putative RNA-directed DNA polymerase from transposon X-element, partial [Orchesella cincta]
VDNPLGDEPQAECGQLKVDNPWRKRCPTGWTTKTLDNALMAGRGGQQGGQSFGGGGNNREGKVVDNPFGVEVANRVINKALGGGGQMQGPGQQKPRPQTRSANTAMAPHDQPNGKEAANTEPGRRTIDDLYTLIVNVQQGVQQNNIQNTSILEKLDGIAARQDVLEGRMDKMESRQEEVPTRVEVNTQLSALRQEMDEQSQRVLRKNNVVIFGIPETEQGTELFHDLMEILLPRRKEYDFERIGDPDKSNVRPVRVFLENPSQVKKWQLQGPRDGRREKALMDLLEFRRNQGLGNQVSVEGVQCGNKFEELYMLLSTRNLDVLCLTETWLDQNEICPLPRGYEIVRSDRSERGGGVAIVLKNKYTAKELKIDRSTWKLPSSLEVVAVTLQYKFSKSVNVACVYRTEHVKNDVKNLHLCFEMLGHINKNCYIFGDFNINVGVESRDSSNLLLAAKKQGFEQIVNQPTRGDKTIDLCFVKILVKNCVQHVVVEDLAVSDHRFISVNYRFQTEARKKIIEVKNYRGVDWECLIECVNDNIRAKENLQQDFDQLVSLVQFCYKTFVPTIKKEVKDGVLEVSTSEKTKRLLAIRKYHYDLWRSTSLEWHRKKSKEFEKLVRKSIDSDMKEMVQKKIANTSVWDTYKSISSINFKNQVKLPDDICPEDLNNYYCETGFIDGASIVNTLLSGEAVKPGGNDLFFVEQVTQSELYLAWKRVRRKLSKKPDTMGIPKYFLDKLMPIPAFNEIILKVVNESFLLGVVPDSMKVARVTPIPKKANASKPADFRPVSITSNLLLLKETIYHRKLVTFLEAENIITNSQFGCRKGHSTELAMIAVVEAVYKNLDKGLIAVLLSIDMRKAFDSVPKGLLLNHLKSRCRISDYWLRSYLGNRKQFVEVNGACSSIREVLIGVPAGSVLGPILFALYINDLPSCVINGVTIIFVDDSNFLFFGTLKDLKALEDMINADMLNVCNYFQSKGLTLNSDKTKMITLSSARKVSKLDSFTIVVNQVCIENSKTMKCLGLTFDRSLTWSKHIENVTKVCYIRIRALYKIRNCFNKSQLKMLGQSLVLSIMSYMIVVVGTTCDKYLKALDKIVRTLGRMILRVRKFDPVAERIRVDLKLMFPKELFVYRSL